MSRKFISLIAGAAVALTAFTAAPARADNDDAAKALALILGLAVVGSIINDNRKDRDVHVTRKKTIDTVRPIQPRPLPKRVRNHKLLPQECFRTFRGRRGDVHGFGARCLDRNYRHAHTLPNHCAARVQTRHGWGWAYRARCLRDRGYTLARR